MTTFLSIDGLGSADGSFMEAASHIQKQGHDCGSTFLCSASPNNMSGLGATLTRVAHWPLLKPDVLLRAAVEVTSAGGRVPGFADQM